MPILGPPPVWVERDYDSTARILGGLIILRVEAHGRSPVVIDNKRYGRSTVQAMAKPGNRYWQAWVRGAYAKKVGEFNTQQEAMLACEKSWRRVFRERNMPCPA